MNNEEIILKTKEAAISEIKKYGMPGLQVFEFSYNKGKELAEKLGADVFIVQMGTILMDYKLGESFVNGKIKEHTRVSSKEAKKILEQYDLPEEATAKIINCIDSHHNTQWANLEAEICANADCYRFLTVKNWLRFLHSLRERKDDFEGNFKTAEDKFYEKLKILSLDACKEELKLQIEIIKGIIKLASAK
jgi:hypothetical protein